MHFPFPFAQNRILCYHTLYVSIHLKKCVRSTTLTWFWGPADIISIKHYLLEGLTTIHTSNIRISTVACKGRCIGFSGEFKGPRLTDNESHNVSSTPNVIELYLNVAQYNQLMTQQHEKCLYHRQEEILNL